MADATGSHSSEVLIKSIINLGSGLGLRIVAEGVETAEVLEELRQMGCDVIQGYYIGRPMPADQLDTGLLKSGMQTFGSTPRPRDGERHL